MSVIVSSELFKIVTNNEDFKMNKAMSKKKRILSAVTAVVISFGLIFGGVANRKARAEAAAVNGGTMFEAAEVAINTAGEKSDKSVKADFADELLKDAMEWIDAYYTFLKDEQYLSAGQEYGTDSELTGLLFDMDHDGVPELLLDNCKMGNATGFCYVYSYVGGKVEYIGNASRYLYVDYDKGYKGQLYGLAGEMEYFIRKYTKNGNTITSEVLEEYGAITNDVPRKWFCWIGRKNPEWLLSELKVYRSLVENGFDDPAAEAAVMDDLLGGLGWLWEDYDCGSIKTDYFLMDLSTGLLTNLRFYPGNIIENDPYDYTSNSGKNDPKGKFNTGFFQIDGEGTDWVLKNIYNVSDGTVEGLHDNESYSHYYYNSDYYTSSGGVGGGFDAYLNDIEIIDGVYHVSYTEACIADGPGDIIYTQKYALMEYKIIDGRGWWSVYKTSEEPLEDTEAISVEIGTVVSDTISYPGGSVRVTLNEEMFMRDNKKYHKDISTLAVALSAAAYDDSFGEAKGLYLYEAYRKLGFLPNDIQFYSYPDNPNGRNDRSDDRFKDKDMSFSIASRKLDDYTLLVVDFRGTSSIADIIKDASIIRPRVNFYGKKNAWPGFHDFWQDYNLAICSYLEKHEEVRKAGENGKIILLITGHSLGAAAANLTAKAANEGNAGIDVSADKIFVYTYACPNVSTQVSNDKNIFNIINESDIIPDMPAGLKRYGNDLIFASGDVYGMFGHGFDRYVNAVAEGRVEESDDFWKHIGEGAKEEHKKSLKYFATFCPVNMEVRKDGKLIGKVVDNAITDAVDESCFYVEGDKKIFFPPDDDTYEVILTAYDEGKMDVFICSSDGDKVDMKNYLDITLEKDDVFVSKIGTPKVVVDAKLDVTHKDGSTETIEATDSSESKIESEGKSGNTEKTWLVIVIIAVGVIVAVIVILLLLRGKRRRLQRRDTANAGALNTASQTSQAQMIEYPRMNQARQSEQQIQPVSQLPIEQHQVMPQQRFKTRFCANCGSPLDSEQLFCGACGTKRL